MRLGKKKLYECAPNELGFETLSKLQSALVGRLVLVNMEIRARLQDAARPEREFHLSLEEIDGFNLMLDHLLIGAGGKALASRPAVEG